MNKSISNNGLGYLIWVKIPHELLSNPRLGSLLKKDLSHPRGTSEKDVAKAKKDVYEVVEALSKYGITRIRTGVSWAEWDTPYGQSWIEWYINLFVKHFKVLANLAFTPPHLGEKEMTNSPPRNLISFSKFTHVFCERFGDKIKEIELWNEWNLVTDWNGDPEYKKFKVMILAAALVAKFHKKKVVLGGMSGVNSETLRNLLSFTRSGLLEYLDVIGIHNLRGTWSDRTPPLRIPTQIKEIKKATSVQIDKNEKLNLQNQVLLLGQKDHQILKMLKNQLWKTRKKELSIWLTEYGFPPVDLNNKFSPLYLENIQVALFAYTLNLLNEGKLDRAYWYTLKDSHSLSLRAITTGWEDVLQYYYGNLREDGSPKLLGRLLLEGGYERVTSYALENNLERLVEQASLKRYIPEEYTSQAKKK